MKRCFVAVVLLCCLPVMADTTWGYNWCPTASCATGTFGGYYAIPSSAAVAGGMSVAVSGTDITFTFAQDFTPEDGAFIGITLLDTPLYLNATLPGGFDAISILDVGGPGQLAWFQFVDGFTFRSGTVVTSNISLGDTRQAPIEGVLEPSSLALLGVGLLGLLRRRH